MSLQIASIRTRADGRGVFTMSNGQIWVQVDGQTPRRVRAGDQATIRRAALGSFLMSLPHGPAVRVRRQE